MDKLVQQDRVTFGETVKMQMEHYGGRKYESRDVFVSYSSDLAVDESFEEGLKRVKAKVQSAIATCEADIKGGPEPDEEEKELEELHQKALKLYSQFRIKNPKRATEIVGELKGCSDIEIFKAVIKEMQDG